MRVVLPLRSALLIVLLLPACRETRSVDHGAPPELIVLFSIDTLRADRIGSYGYGGASTPNIDSFAEDAILYESAWAHVPLTLPSHVTVLSGQLPSSTGVRDNLGFPVPEELLSFPELLADAGYQTAGFVSSWVLRGETGIGRMFDHWDDQLPNGSAETVGELSRGGEETVAASLRWLRSTSGPRLVFVHIFEPHTPYDPPEEFQKPEPYDGEVSHADALFGELIRGLEELGLYDDALVVLFSDHGEGLGDHGEAEHGIFLYREALQVPLIVRWPGGSESGTRVSTPVGLVDVAPTLLSGAKLDHALLGGDGEVLPRREGGEPGSRVIVSETMYPRIHLGWSELVSAVEGKYHLIDAPTVELYDVLEDPGEVSNAAQENRRVVARLREATGRYDRSLDMMSAVSRDEAARLASLGYLSGGTTRHGPLPDPKDRISELQEYQRAATLLGSGDLERSLRLLKAVTAENESFADAWILRGRVEERLGQLDEAVESYRFAIDVAPNLAPGTSLAIARVLTRAGRLDEAEAHLALAGPTHPDAVLIATARIRLAARDHRGALELAGRVDRESSLFADARLLTAEALVAGGALRRALELLDSLENQTGQNVQLVRGDALARSGRVGEAKEAFRREIASWPRNTEAYIRLMALELLSGDQTSAETTAELLYEHVPTASQEIESTYRSLGRSDLADAWKQRSR